MKTNVDKSPIADTQELLAELNAIKRLLALLLLRQGAPQEQVAKAARVAKLTINQLANAGSGKAKQIGGAGKTRRE